MRLKTKRINVRNGYDQWSKIYDTTPNPLTHNSFDAVLCALVGEHLTNLRTTFNEIFRSLKECGRFIFSVFHPEMAASGIEANFTRDNIEY
jgi:SAM-dependent methyltransferase